MLQRQLLDMSLGFAAGVMLAASFWSLLNPAIEMAEESGFYGQKGEFAFVPVVIGFIVGTVFVYGTDILISYMGVSSPQAMLSKYTSLNQLPVDYNEKGKLFSVLVSTKN